MKYFIFFIFLLLLSSCSTPKSVYICGDHECINKKEANAYFKEYLSIEIKILDKNQTSSYDLVQLNTKEIPAKEKKMKIFNNKSEIKKLSKEEIEKKKAELLERKKLVKINQKNIESKRKEDKKILKLNKKKQNKIKDKIVKKNMSINKSLKVNKKVYKNEICAIIEKCNIDEIAKYLLDKSSKKDFPDLSKE